MASHHWLYIAHLSVCEGARIMLNFAEASALDTALANYIMLYVFGPLILIVAWNVIISYFQEPASDELSDKLDEVIDAIRDTKTADTEVNLYVD